LSSPAASINTQAETVVAAAKSEFGSYDSWDTTNNSRTPKRQRREFEEKVQERLQEIQNADEQEHQDGEDGGQQSMRCPRATYPENFKSSRSRSRTVSDVSVGSHYLVPFEGPPSLPCTPRASLGNSATVSATATAEASPCPTGSMFSREALRFVSIATPSPANTPKSASRSCSRSGGPVTGSGGSSGSGSGARQYAGRKQYLSQHHAYASQAHAQQLSTSLDAASTDGCGNAHHNYNGAGGGVEIVRAPRALDNVLEEDEQEKETSAEPQDAAQKRLHEPHGGEPEDGEEAELANTFDAQSGDAGQMTMCADEDGDGSGQAQQGMAVEQGDQPRTALEVLRALGAAVQAAAGAAMGRMLPEQEDEELLFALEM
jgi:hypothetical protein